MGELATALRDALGGAPHVEVAAARAAGSSSLQVEVTPTCASESNSRGDGGSSHTEREVRRRADLSLHHRPDPPSSPPAKDARLRRSSGSSCGCQGERLALLTPLSSQHERDQKSYSGPSRAQNEPKGVLRLRAYVRHVRISHVYIVNAGATAQPTQSAVPPW